MSKNVQHVAKFNFDTEFRAEGDLVSNAARARQRKVFTQEEIDQMFAKARGEGLKAGQVRAAEALSASVAQFGETLRTTLSGAQRELENLREEASRIAFTAARKLAPIAIAAFPVGDDEEALREAIHHAIGEPRVELRASQDVIDALAGRLEEIAHDEGFDGRIVASADPGIAGGDCRIEWRGGGAERSLAALEAAVGELITRRFAQSTHTNVTKG